MIAVTVLLLQPFLLFSQSLSWIRSWSDTSYVAAVAAADEGGAYAAGGFTENEIPGVARPSFVTRLDRFGNRMWTRMLA